MVDEFNEFGSELRLAVHRVIDKQDPWLIKREELLVEEEPI